MEKLLMSGVVTRIGAVKTEPVYVNGVATEAMKSYIPLKVEGIPHVVRLWKKSNDQAEFQVEVGDTVNLLHDTYQYEGVDYISTTAFPSGALGSVASKELVNEVEELRVAAEIRREERAKRLNGVKPD